MAIIGKLKEGDKLRFKREILKILSNGGEKREVNEWYFFYDNRNFYCGYCLITEWEEMNKDKGENK